MVKDIDREGVTFDGPNGQGRLDARTVIWAGGVTVPAFARVLAKRMNADTDKAGRIKVSPDLTVPSHPDIYVIGDLALVAGRGRKPFARCGPSGNAARNLCRERNPEQDTRQEGAAAVQ